MRTSCKSPAFVLPERLRRLVEEAEQAGVRVVLEEGQGSDKAPSVSLTEDGGVLVRLPAAPLDADGEEAVAHRLALAAFRRRMPTFMERISMLAAGHRGERPEALKDAKDLMLAYLGDTLMHCAVEKFLQDGFGYPVLQKYYAYLDEALRALACPDEDLVFPPEVSVLGVFAVAYTLDPRFAKRKLRKMARLSEGCALGCRLLASVIERHGVEGEENLLACLEDLAENFRILSTPEENN